MNTNATSVVRGTASGSQRLGTEPVRYLIASAIALLVDLGSFSAGMRLAGMGWMSSAMLGFALGVTATYLLSILWVFQTRRLTRKPRLEFATFISIGIAGLGVTQIVLWIGIEHFHWQSELVRLLAAGITFAFNYYVRVLTLFRKFTSLA